MIDADATVPGEDESVQTRLAAEQVRSKLFGEAEPVRIGRFTVLGVLGRGGAGWASSTRPMTRGWTGVSP